MPVQLPVYWPVPAAIQFLNFCPSAHAIHVFRFFGQLFRHKWASNWHQMYANMCQCRCRSVGHCRRPVILLFLPVPYMYFKSFANYFGINGLQTGTKCKIGLMHARQAFTCCDMPWLKSCESRQLGKRPVIGFAKLLLRQYNDNRMVTSFKQVPQPSPHSWSLLAALDDHGISCLPMLPLYHSAPSYNHPWIEGSELRT